VTFEQIIWGTTTSIFFVSLVYLLTGWRKILDCYKLWLTKQYWKSYNIVEAASWITKAIIIIPGLIFGVQIWWLYFFTLLTSLMLIWASNEKLLPTLVGFNSLWVWLSCMVLAQTLID
jgi:hypothetical protein